MTGSIVATYVLGGNIVLAGLLGVCPVLSVWSSPRRALAVGCSLFFVCSLTASASWVVDRLILSALGVEWLGLAATMLLAALCTRFMDRLVRAVSPVLHAVLAPHTEQTTLSSAVLGVALQSLRADYRFLDSFVAGLAGAGGFLLAAALMASIHQKVELEPVPRPLRGAPVGLITLSLMALAFLGFRGIGG